MNWKEFVFTKKEEFVENKDKSDEILVSYIINLFREKKLNLKKIDDSEIIFEKIKL